MKKRPIYLNLFQIRLPITAIISILHRISGVVLFLTLPGLLCWLQLSLSSEEGFTEAVEYFNQTGGQLFAFVVMAALIYHVAAGCRHLLMDMGFGESKEGGKISAYGVIAASLVLLIGYLLW